MLARASLWETTCQAAGLNTLRESRRKSALSWYMSTPASRNAVDLERRLMERV